MADKVTIIKGKVEEIELPVDKVDIIIRFARRGWGGAAAAAARAAVLRLC